jgi:pimeloyl-ACP methyl ester carboxylesterase
MTYKVYKKSGSGLLRYLIAVVLFMASVNGVSGQIRGVRPVTELVSPPAPGAGTIVSSEYLGELSTAGLSTSLPSFFESYETPVPRYPVRSWTIRYLSTDFDGSQVTIHAQVFAPVLSQPAELPMYVFASGTTGIGDECAPSLEVTEQRRWGWYTQNMLAYASQGYLVVFPDYTGFHDPLRTQRYFSKYAEGYMMLDAIRAGLAFFASSETTGLGARPSRSVFTSGYSQGGHAAMAAADLRPHYAPDLPLSGIITYGSTNDVEALMREGVAYTPLILNSYREMYGSSLVNVADYLLPKWVENFDTQSLLCVDQFQALYGFDAAGVYTPRFKAALNGGTLARDFPALAVLVAENHTGLSGHGLPALVIQGSLDFIVTDATQTRFVTALRERGSQTRFLIYPQVTHRYTRHAGFNASLVWMQEQIAAGR